MRETRSYGSARGVRSNPYPYRDIPSTPCAARQDFDFALGSSSWAGTAGRMAVIIVRIGSRPGGQDFG